MKARLRTLKSLTATAGKQGIDYLKQAYAIVNVKTVFSITFAISHKNPT